MSKKILVTGGAGFIGSHTCIELLNNGNEVVVVDNLYNANKKSLEVVEKVTGKKVTFYEVDIRDEEKLNEVFETDKIALYCGTGWRNAIPWFMTQLTGRANTYFYDGGWNDWQLEGSLPVDINKDKGAKPDAKNDFK